ncbi:sigma-54-dependent Fis family transcriptional regulator [Desulfuromonas acetoxidans]|uniref:Two component, sigma54 specific, transcriptional regulator, Fis family n=1 Tax=Desulfuromonas acetoxidans (strain DSM 684 / 11070) TaxID=281689 RepID=Q1JVH2_DESA6|nr:sigma-54 dependent transcriptional regulator [Desulfuromonas acetoxidans]EAT14241.1 two component, sigma54 specific, transcriptional regulator, Fis family [Desulfuromonas acetoxidans DSM 684]MBF0645811.1 sigma-54-dependent Fis family transcriptional regulator [Desulfuromonas acetoxidans]NVD24801.1 sigma-54-dependent Fis family transcriptional regulator [Desulfuromonas acetoxidans]NVE16846.1 sigma-54-dependent Fis family transcriptional regulator [Desulfuromonas acetoxidans]
MSKNCSILIVDDESAMRHLLQTILEEEEYQVDAAENGKQALEKVEHNHYDLVLCDVRMPELDGIGFLSRILPKFPSLTVIMMSAYGSLETALNCMKNGAYDYISKPFRPDEIILTLKKAQERLRLQRENETLRRELRSSGEQQQIIGDSTAIKQVLHQVETLATVASPVLIQGETGTGKELIARALHEHSPRAKAPFVAVNCSALSPQLVESELFGHRKGAFTGATQNHPGLFYAANGGTLFLDEIGELPLEFQPKLLRALQEREILAVGETKPRKIDVRIIAATAKNLKESIEQGNFREDLYYRLAVVELTVPTLRSRKEDIPSLCAYFLQKIATREGRPIPRLTSDANEALQNYSWPGNVRELQNVIEKTLIFCRGLLITATDLPQEIKLPASTLSSVDDDISLKKATEVLEQRYIKAALERTNGKRAQAAEMLEISLRSLQYKIKDYDL